jgi:hypothetical protein
MSTARKQRDAAVSQRRLATMKTLSSEQSPKTSQSRLKARMGKMLNDRPRNRYPSSASLPPTALCQQTKRNEIEQHAERTFKFKLQVNEEQGNAKTQKAQGTRTD